MPASPLNVVERLADGLAIVRLNRPDRLNALSQEAVSALTATLDEIARDDSLRVVILTGEGRGFCAGWDLKSKLQGEDGGESGVSGLYGGQERFAGMIRRLREMGKVVIAAVNGVAVGAGLGLALAADIRLAARSASFHIGAIRIGLTAGECGISYHLPRLVGASRAFELMLTGRPVDAEEAARIGLVSAVADDASLIERARSMAGDILRNSPYSVRQTKRLMWANLEAPSLDAAIELENRAQVLALLTDDFAEASAAFAEKRPPRFTGR
ncbi:enoyl-CoA hydratase/isomerase family protein [Noviherbaspirillum sp. ST9]|uniref:enoyl-CoA hydratase/isomerase family protein n=1 Tax=Noviherbaspirillum sp. ST9 TaxID=3401606 RepID=UPI003B5870FC